MIPQLHQNGDVLLSTHSVNCTKELFLGQNLSKVTKETSVPLLILNASPELMPARFQKDRLFWLLLGNGLEIPKSLCQSFG